MKNKTTLNEEQIERLLNSIQPKPSERYYHRMVNAPWTEMSLTSASKRLIKPRFRIALAAALAVLLVLMILAATPQGRAWAQGALRFFSRTESNTLPDSHPTEQIVLVEVTPGVVFTPVPTPTSNIRSFLPFYDQCGEWASPTCTVEQVRRMVDFPVKELARIPDGMRLLGATGGPDEVWIQYQRDDHMGDILLSQGPWTDDMAESWKVALTATVETVSIGNITGEYLIGSWLHASASDTFATWDPSSDSQTLRWREGDLFYTMMVTGSPEDQGRRLGKDGMAALAAGLTTQPAGVVQDTTRLKTAQEAGALAGIEVIEPESLPDGYTFKNASYVTETNSVCLYYMHSGDESVPSLGIVEGASRPFPTLGNVFHPSPEDMKIGVFVITETLPIGGAVDERGLYASGSIYETPYCDNGGVSQALIVQMADSWFIIFARQNIGLRADGYLTKLEMEKLAENITGVHTVPEGQLDLQRLPSVEAAEQLAGFHINTPTRLPAGSAFEYASYLQSDSVKEIDLAYTNFTISARFGVTATLGMIDEQSHGNYKKLSVNGQPALYMQGCGTDQGWDWDCFGTLDLTWFEDGVEYQIWAVVGDLDESTTFAIAESMR